MENPLHHSRQTESCCQKERKKRIPVLFSLLLRIGEGRSPDTQDNGEQQHARRDSAVICRLQEDVVRMHRNLPALQLNAHLIMTGPVQPLQIRKIQPHSSVGKVSRVNGPRLELRLRGKEHRCGRLSQHFPESRKAALVCRGQQDILPGRCRLPKVCSPVALRNIPLIAVINLRSDLTAENPVAEVPDENFHIHERRAVPCHVAENPVVIRLELRKTLRMRVHRGNQPLSREGHREGKNQHQEKGQHGLCTGFQTEARALFPRPQIPEVERRDQKEQGENPDAGPRKAHGHVRARKSQEKSLLPGSCHSPAKIQPRALPEFPDKERHRRRADDDKIIGRHGRRVEMHGKPAVHVGKVIPVQHRVSHFERKIQKNSLTQILQKTILSCPEAVAQIEQKPDSRKKRRPESRIPENQDPDREDNDNRKKSLPDTGERLLLPPDPVRQHADERRHCHRGGCAGSRPRRRHGILPGGLRILCGGNPVMYTVDYREQHADHRHGRRLRVAVGGNVSHQKRNQTDQHHNPRHRRVMDIVVGGIHVVRAFAHDQRNAGDDAVMPDIFPRKGLVHKIRDSLPAVPEAVQAPASAEKNARFIDENIRNSSVEQPERPDCSKGKAEHQNGGGCEAGLHRPQHRGYRIPLREFPEEQEHQKKGRRENRRIAQSAHHRRPFRLRDPVQKRGLQRRPVDSAVVVKSGLIERCLAGGKGLRL